jgi:probable HAF family extracellular repeat protein
MTRQIAVFGVAVLLSMVGRSACGQYSVTDLGPGKACAINASGQVAGQTGSGYAFLYSNGTMTNLGALGGSESFAFGINDSGQVVGFADASSGQSYAFLYSNGTMAQLGTLPGDLNSEAAGINDSGQVVGDSGSNAGYQAFLYSNGTMTGFGNFNSTAYGINASGQVVGVNAYTSSADHAFLYSNGTMTDLGILPGGTNSSATGINASGEVVGNSFTGTSGGGYQHAFLYSHGTMTDLGLLPGCDLSCACGINASGQVVGYSGVAAIPASRLTSANGIKASGPLAPLTDAGDSGGAFLYSNGTMTNLNTLINPNSGWTLEEANAINDSGQIVGLGINPSGQSDAFLLTPLTPGDANGDGRVDINDLTIVLTNLGKTGMTWSQGDFTGDGTVSTDDITIVLANYYHGVTVAGIKPVPEPSCAVLLALGAIGLLGFAWRKRIRTA